VSFTASYQFFENVFVHPYLTGGTRVAWISETTEERSTTSPYRIVTTSHAPDRAEARPVLGGGFKSYFDNGRVFMRTELLLVVDIHGTSRPILRIGAGVDF
jgi:hypothetical protein